MTNDQTYKKQQKISSISFAIDIPNLIAVLTSAIVSNSILTWLDFVDSLGGFISDTFVVFQSRKLSRNLMFEYNYGVGKLEAITTFLTQSIQTGGLLCVLFVSILELFDPSQPSDALIYVLILKTVNIILDSLLLFGQYRINKEHHSAVTESELNSFIGSLLFDCATFASILIVWLLRNNKLTWYISPILSILIGLYLLSRCLKHIKRAIYELTDKTLPEAEQLKILKAIVKLDNLYLSFGSINSRYNGNDLEIDVNVKFNPDCTYTQMEEFRTKLQEELDKEIDNCRVALCIFEDK